MEIMGFHWYWGNGVSLTTELVPVRQAHFKSDCKWLSVQNNRADSEDSSWVLTDIHTSYSRKLKPATVPVSYSSSFFLYSWFLAQIFSSCSSTVFLYSSFPFSHICTFFFITVVAMKIIFFWYFPLLHPILSQMNPFHFGHSICVI